METRAQASPLSVGGELVHVKVSLDMSLHRPAEGPAVVWWGGLLRPIEGLWWRVTYTLSVTL